MTARIEPTAAMIAIGDELLSGRTRDRNIGHFASVMTLKGIDLKEARIVSDDEAAIVEAVNALRARHTHVVTCGGIGPTHDDITADAIAAAFGVPIGHDPRAMALLSAHYAARGLEFTDARKRMARIPHGAELIENPVSVAPGFRIGNVHVLAGVPSVFEAMLDKVVATFQGGRPILSLTLECQVPEGVFGSALAEIQKRHPETSIGSYPRFADGRVHAQIVVRSREDAAAAAAEAEVRAMIEGLLAAPAAK